MTIVFGIKNCDTVKKARKWLDARGHSYQFHDFRLDGIDIEKVAVWAKRNGKDNLINKRSTTWKQLDDNEKSHFEAPQLNPQSLQIIAERPTLLKRPIIERNGETLLGFDSGAYNAFFK